MEPVNALVAQSNPMTQPLQRVDDSAAQAVALAGPVPLGSYALHIERTQDGHLLRLVGPDGGKSLEIALTDQGPVLRLNSNLRMDLSGDLAVEARHVSLHGREGLTLTSGSDAVLAVAGDLSLRAELGDIQVRANDDVRLDGERIRMNC
jgi:hypothetical protein